jgi:hypothetical protein
MDAYRIGYVLGQCLAYALLFCGVLFVGCCVIAYRNRRK